MTLKEAAEVNMAASRDSARGVLESKIRQLKKKAWELQQLSDMLPKQLTAEQDEALWSIAVGINIG